jgi:hypothetical protein
VDDKLLGELPPEAFDAEMKRCLQHADEMQSDGKLVSFQQLDCAGTCVAAGEAPPATRRFAGHPSLMHIKSRRWTSAFVIEMR